MKYWAFLRVNDIMNTVLGVQPTFSEGDLEDYTLHAQIAITAFAALFACVLCVKSLYGISSHLIGLTIAGLILWGVWGTAVSNGLIPSEFRPRMPNASWLQARG